MDQLKVYIRQLFGKRKATRRPCIVMMGTSPEAKGGIATVVSHYRDSGLLKGWGIRYIVTHVQRSRWKKMGIALTAMLQLCALLVLGRVTLLHIHVTSGASTWRKLMYVYTAMLFRVPTCIHIHSGDYFEFYHARCNPFQKGIIRYAFRRANRVIALSASWLNGIHSISAEAMSTVVYNAVPLNWPARTALRGAGAPGDMPMLLYLGQICANKGVFDLIQACAEVTCNFRLVIAGDGDVDAARALAQDLGIEEKIDFPGWVRGERKDRLLLQARALVLPSYTEGIPMSILEAMACGVPVIATPVGGIPETMADGREGIMVPVGDIRVLRHAIERLLRDDALCCQLGEAGRKRIASEYSPAAVYPRLEAVWAAAGARPPEAVCDSQPETWGGHDLGTPDSAGLHLKRNRQR